MNPIKKHGLLIVTLLGWMATSLALYYTQYMLYGGAIKTIWLYVLIFVPALLIAMFLKNDDATPPRKTSKIWDSVTIVIASLIVILYIFYSPYDARAWNWALFPLIAILLVVFKPLKEKLKDQKHIKVRCLFIVTMYLFLIAEPFVFAAITGA